MLQCMVRAEPSWKPKVILNDAKLAEDSITHVFPEANIFLCWWHIVYRLFVINVCLPLYLNCYCNLLLSSLNFRDIDKKDNLGSDAQVDIIREFVKNEFVFGINPNTTIAEKWVVFQNTFSARATEYMSQWMSTRYLYFYLHHLSIFYVALV
jgi:hypothetical protein